MQAGVEDFVQVGVEAFAQVGAEDSAQALEDFVEALGDFAQAFAGDSLFSCWVAGKSSRKFGFLMENSVPVSTLRGTSFLLFIMDK